MVWLRILLSSTLRLRYIPPTLATIGHAVLAVGLCVVTALREAPRRQRSDGSVRIVLERTYSLRYAFERPVLRVDSPEGRFEETSHLDDDLAIWHRLLHRPTVDSGKRDRGHQKVARDSRFRLRPAARIGVLIGLPASAAQR